MNTNQIQEWLSEINSISDDDLRKFTGSSATGAIGAFLQDSGPVIEILMDYFRINYANEENIEPIFSQLINSYYRGGPLRIFVLQFIPSLIGTYLGAVNGRQRDSCILIETLFLTLYNEEILEKDGPKRKDLNRTDTGPLQKQVHTVRIPSVSIPSLYHDPGKICQSILPDSSLLNRLTAPSSSSWDLCPGSAGSVVTVKIGPFPSASRICYENRYLVLTKILKSTCQHLSQMHHPSVAKSICRLATSLCRSGFHFADSGLTVRILGSEPPASTPRDVFQSIDDFSSRTRIPLNSIFLLELINGVYYALFNGMAETALPPLDAIHQRAGFELYSDVLLVTNSIINSLLENPSGTPREEGPMGIRVVATSPFDSGLSRSPMGSHKMSTNEKPRRTLITNASLRIRRMPEDIPVKSPIEGTNNPVNSPVNSNTSKKEGVEISLRKKVSQVLKTDTGRLSLGLSPMKPSKSEVNMEQIIQTERKLSKAKLKISRAAKHDNEDSVVMEMSDIVLHEVQEDDAVVTNTVIDSLIDETKENGHSKATNSGHSSDTYFTPRKMNGEGPAGIRHADSSAENLAEHL